MRQSNVYFVMNEESNRARHFAANAISILSFFFFLSVSVFVCISCFVKKVAVHLCS